MEGPGGPFFVGGWPGLRILCEGRVSSVVIQNENPRPVSPKTGETRAPS
jgi:hypothetical protein